MFDALKKYAVIEGRANRREFWLFYLLVLLSAICALIIDVLTGVFLTGVFVVTILVALFFFIPAITLGVRRLHDFDKSGWWWLSTFIPVLGIFIWLFIGLLAGTEKNNRFGAVPKE